MASALGIGSGVGGDADAVAGEFERHPGLRTRRLEDVGLAVGRKRRRRRRQLRDLGRQGTGADRSGDLVIEDSVLCANPSAGFETDGLPGIFMLAADGNPQISSSELSVARPQG